MEKEKTLEKIQEAYFYVLNRITLNPIIEDLKQSSKNIKVEIGKVNKEIEDQDTYLSPKWTIISIVVLGVIFWGILSNVLNPYGRISNTTLYFLFGVVIFFASFAGAWKLVQIIEKKILQSKIADLNNKKKNLENYYDGISKLTASADEIMDNLNANVPNIVLDVPDNRSLILAYYGELYEIIRTGQAKDLASGIKVLEDRWRDKKEIDETDNVSPLSLYINSNPDPIYQQIEALGEKVKNYLGK